MAQQANAPPEAPSNFYSLDKERALGKQIAFEVLRRTRAVKDSKIDEYVTGLGRRLSVSMRDPKPSFTFSVIVDDACPATHEPASLPGGYVFLPASLFLEAHSEAELSGMLAHSMAHTAAPHGMLQASRAQAQKPGTIPLIFIGGWNGSCAGALALPVGSGRDSEPKNWKLILQRSK